MEEERLIISRLPEDVLKPHPDNPRKDLGDLTELTESIKVNGIMQNLTVIPTKDLPGGDPNSERYTILIGHRRFAAGKAAGLTVFPCRIVRGLSHAEQVAIMLEENIQRNDLTLLEQAEGMQMLLDLGETYETITQKTGFSQSTIRHRINLLKLDPDLFKEKQHQLTLKDFAKLESIPEERRDEALQGANSSGSIQAAVERIAEEEKAKKLKKEAREWLIKHGITEEDNMRCYGSDVKYVSLENDWKDKVEELGGDIEAFCIPSRSWQQCVYLRIAVGETEEEERELSPEEILAEDLKQANIKRCDMMDDIVKTESERLHKKMVEYLFQEEWDEYGYEDDQLIDMMDHYMELSQVEAYNYDALVDPTDAIIDSLNINRDEYEDPAEEEEADLRYHELPTGVKIIISAAGKLLKPFRWNHTLEIDNVASNGHAVKILTYIPFKFSFEMEQLMNGKSILYNEVTEETLYTWDKEFE